jgi:hypothetical protein
VRTATSRGGSSRLFADGLPCRPDPAQWTDSHHPGSAGAEATTTLPVGVRVADGRSGVDVRPRSVLSSPQAPELADAASILPTPRWFSRAARAHSAGPDAAVTPAASGCTGQPGSWQPGRVRSMRLEVVMQAAM